MFNRADGTFIALCLEGFFYGLYSGIFAMYLQCLPSESRTATIVFYALCLLYVLSTVNVVVDLANNVLGEIVDISSLALLQFHIAILQNTASGCCDFLAQCILIYRCWIVWGQNIRVVIVPSILAITYLATWLASVNGTSFVQGELVQSSWGIPILLTSFILSIAVNTLVTGLIVFRIHRVFLEIKAATTSVELTLGTTGGTKLRNVMFIIIESGMALLVVQLARVVIAYLQVQSVGVTFASDLTVVINEMFNGITPTIILLRVSMRLSFDNKESFMEAAGSLRFNNPPSDPNSTHQQLEVGSSNMPPEERNEDIYFNNPSNDPNTLPKPANEDA